MGKKTFWDRFAFAYDTFEGFNKQVYRAMLMNTVELIPDNAEVLECAAGTGAISIAVASKAKSVLCTDLSLPMLERAQQKAKKAGIRTEEKRFFLKQRRQKQRNLKNPL